MSRPPAITDLSNPREVAFVTALLDLGGPQYATEAAMRAGYADTEADAERAAAFLLGAPRIARAITKEIRHRFDVGAAIAFHTLLEVCVNTKAPANARISAAQEILNRSSIGPVVSRSLGVRVEGGVEDILAELDRREAEGARRAAGDAGVVIEGAGRPSRVEDAG